MKATRCFLLGILFFTGISCAYSQQAILPVDSAIQVEGNGLFRGQLKPSGWGKEVQVYTAGAFVALQISKVMGYLRHPVYYRAYTYSSRGPSDTAKLIYGSDQIRGGERIGQVYLKVNDTFLIDFRDRRTDSLVKRYKIKRVMAIPEVILDRLPNNRGHLQGVILEDHPAKFDLSAGELLNIRLTKKSEFQEDDIEYTLVDLKTRKTKRKISRFGFGPLKLASNTDYELRFGYLLQPESTGTFYIHVKPYWYQSVLTYIILIIGLCATSVSIILLVSKSRLKAVRNRQYNAEQAALRLQAQLNPHFTFNSLNSIQGLMNTGRIEEANDYLQEFSSLLRKTLVKSEYVFNSLDQELEMMRTYIRLEALRYNFTWDIEVAVDIHSTVIEIPTLILQPLIENAIRHGLAGLGHAGQLYVNCKREEEAATFIIVIRDNGTWIDKRSGSDAGYGLTLTAERIAAINKLHKWRSIELAFNKHAGTEAVLTFHNWL